MITDPREVEAMARLNRIMRGEFQEGDLAESSNQDVPTSGGTKGVTPDAVDAMKNIMLAFQGATAVNEQVKESPRFREAIATNRTQAGVQIGSWEIKVNEDSSGKTYDVINVHTNEAIALDLTLYESAHGLAKLLNFHVGINDPKVKRLLALEEEYARYRQDAAVFKVRAKQRQQAGDTFRAAVAEDRFKENRDHAIRLREEIVSYTKTL